MKRNIIIFITIVLLIVSAVFNYQLSGKLEDAQLQSQGLLVDLEESEAGKATLDKALSQEKNKLKDSEEALQTMAGDLQASNEQLQEIDTELRAQGKIIEKIKELKSDNTKWREALNAMTNDFNDIQAQVPEIDESKVQSVSDLEAVIDFIDARIDVLVDATSNLPALSLERIMIQQEVTFLDETKASVGAVMDALSSDE